MASHVLTAADDVVVRRVLSSAGYADGARVPFGEAGLMLVTLDLDVVVLAPLSTGDEAKVTVFTSWTTGEVVATVSIPDPSGFSAADLAQIVSVVSLAGVVADVLAELTPADAL